MPSSARRHDTGRSRRPGRRLRGVPRRALKPLSSSTSNRSLSSAERSFPWVNGFPLWVNRMRNMDPSFQSGSVLNLSLNRPPTATSVIAAISAAAPSTKALRVSSSTTWSAVTRSSVDWAQASPAHQHDQCQDGKGQRSFAVRSHRIFLHVDRLGKHDLGRRARDPRSGRAVRPRSAVEERRARPAAQEESRTRGGGAPPPHPAPSPPYSFPSGAGRSLRSLGSAPFGARGRRGRIWRCRLRPPSALPGRRPGRCGCAARVSAERRASTRAERTIERSERPAPEGNE